MPTYKCKQCGNALTLSIQPGQCEICGASQFRIINQRQSKVTASTFGQKSYQSSLKKDPKYSPPTLPLYSGSSSFTPITKTYSKPLSSKNKKKLFPIRWVLIIIVFILGIVGYGQWQAQFDTTDFRKIVLQESFKTSNNWSLTQGAVLKDGGLYQKQALLNHYGASIWTKKNIQDVDFSADVIKSNGPDDIPFGLITRVSGKDIQNFYYLFIDGKGEFVMGKHDRNSWTHKLRWKKSRAINLGNRKNRLRIVCKNQLIIGFINGKRIGSFRDKTYSSGKVAVFSMRGKGKELSTYFDNVLIKERSTQPTSTISLN